MCCLIFLEISNNNEKVLIDLRRIVNDNEYTPKSPNELCSKLFVTCYMGTENSSDATKNRAQTLASQIGSNHLSIVIDVAVSAVLKIWQTAMSIVPKFRVHGGSNVENAALQNIQARQKILTNSFTSFLTSLYLKI